MVEINHEDSNFDLQTALQELSIELGIPVEQLIRLKDQLAVIHDPNYSTLGHGTRVEAAASIIQEGLRVWFPDLHTTTIPLINPDRTYVGQVPNLLDTILNWPHHNLKGIVVLMIPNVPEESKVGGMTYFNSVIHEISDKSEGDEYAGYRSNFVVPPEYIRGYIDAAKKEFVANPIFAPRVPKVQLPSKLEDITSFQAFGGIGSEAREIPTATSQQIPEDGDVW